MIAEHITTIETSMQMVGELSQNKEANYNQIVRWVSNKEEHANQIQHIVCQYFMTQRVKPVDRENGDAYTKYIKQLTLLHEMLVYAMKTKQSTDLTHVEKLKSLLAEFRQVYFGD
jgi:nickel superoxide dismutase